MVFVRIISLKCLHFLNKVLKINKVYVYGVPFQGFLVYKGLMFNYSYKLCIFYSNCATGKFHGCRTHGFSKALQQNMSKNVRPPDKSA